MKRFIETEPEDFKTTLKKLKYGNTNIPQTLRKAVWEMYIGIGVIETTCPLCGKNKINSNQKSGFQACHIVADKYTYNNDLIVLYLFPGCQSCNLECSDTCLLDFLYFRYRLDALRNMIWNIFQAYIKIHKEELSQHEGLCWKVIQHLYGKETYPAGGGISIHIETDIYKIANSEQADHVTKDINKIAKTLQESVALLHTVTNTEIKPKKL